MPCEEDYIKCDNKQLGMNQLLNLLLTEIAPGVPAVRTCDAGGGAPTELPMPIGNFLFVNPLGDDATGERENFHKPFRTLNAAKNAAAPNLVTGGFLVANGTGYPAPGPVIGAATTGGTGVGLTVDYDEFFPGFITVTVNNPGTGYTNGDVVTIVGGNNDRTFQITVEAQVDTIYVYGGTYNEGNQLHKDGVKWHFVGKPTLNVFASNVWHATGITNIEIAGDAIINHLGIGSVIRVEAAAGPTTTVHADFHKVTGNGAHVLFFNSGTGIINIATKLEVTLVNRCIGLGGDAAYVFNIDDIFCNSFIGGTSNAINLRNQAPVYNGRCVFNCRTIRSDRANGATISFQYGLLTGHCTFNITDKIHFMQPANPAHTDSAIQMLSGSCEVNGDIDGGAGHAVNMETKFFAKKFVHNGNAYNDGTKPVFDCGDDTPSFWSGGLADVKINGQYKGANEKVVVHRGEPNNKISINGEIISNYAGAGTNYGLFLAANANVTLLDNVKIVSDGNGTPYGIGAAAARDVKIIHNVASNVNTDGNITNAITGTSYIQDPDVE